MSNLGYETKFEAEAETTHVGITKRVRLGLATLASWEIPAHRSLREDVTAQHRSLRLHIVRTGALISLDPESTVFPSGNAAVSVDSDRLEVRALRDSTGLTVTVPAEIFDGVPLPRNSTMVIPAHMPLLAATAEFCAQALETTAELGALNRYYFERLIQEMTTGTVIDALRADLVPRAPDAYALAISLISEQSSDSTLTAARVAQEVNISLRQLERAFRERDTTISRQIRLARIDNASQLLSDKNYRQISVAVIARHSGFASGSSLARAMAAEMRPTPSEVRRSGLSQLPE